LVKGATEVAGPLLKGIEKKIHLDGSISWQLFNHVIILRYILPGAGCRAKTW
jgi:hypothetical protein